MIKFVAVYLGLSDLRTCWRTCEELQKEGLRISNYLPSITKVRVVSVRGRFSWCHRFGNRTPDVNQEKAIVKWFEDSEDGKPVVVWHARDLMPRG